MVAMSMSTASAEERKKPAYIVDENLIDNKYLKDALIRNKREGLEMAVKARFFALIVVALLAIFLVQDWSVLYYLFLIALFMLNGWAQLKIGRVGRSRKELLLLFVDITLMGITVGVPNPFQDELWSFAMQYKYANFPYFYIVLAGATLIYSWRTMFAVAWYTLFIWVGVYVWAFFEAPILPEISAQMGLLLADYPHIWEMVDPNSVNLHQRVQEIVVFIIITGILGLNSWRSNRLLERQAEAARERANLARYFAPSLVEHLAERDDPLGEVRSQSVVVMFVDIVGFTKMAEHDEPGRVVQFLREFHGRMETAVFDHKGTLDKFLGDGLMITFGTPTTTPDDAKNALQCAIAMQRTMDEWNAVRSEMGLAQVKLSIGIHCGDVVLGDIGSERRMEFAVLGDVVNVSSRLESLTREIGASIIASQHVVEAAGETLAVDAGYQLIGSKEIRGRDEPVTIWAVQRDT